MCCDGSSSQRQVFWLRAKLVHLDVCVVTARDNEAPAPAKLDAVHGCTMAPYCSQVLHLRSRGCQCHAKQSVHTTSALQWG